MYVFMKGWRGEMMEHLEVALDAENESYREEPETEGGVNRMSKERPPP